MNQFNTLHQEVKFNKKLTVSHKTRLERIVALYNHVTALKRERDATDEYDYLKRDRLQTRLDKFKTPKFFLMAMEALAAEVRAL